jgi:hypothetical protein
VKLTDTHIEELKAAAGRIGEFGKITLAISGGVVDIVTEERVRIRSGCKDSAALLKGGRGETGPA